MINVGLIGYGLAGKVFHVPFIRAVDGLHLSAIVQRSGSNDPALKDVEFVRSVDELLARPVDLVVVATPNSTHHPFATQCLLAGRHVVIDKPFTSTLAQAEDLVHLAARQNRLLTVFQNRRWDGDFMTVQQVLHEGSLGRIVAYESHFDRYRPELRVGKWNEEGIDGNGLLFDLGPHVIDQALVLFGVPEALQADLRTVRDGSAVVDSFDITFYYPHLRALLRSTLLAAANGARFTVHGTEGSFVKFGIDPQEDDMKAGRKITDPNWGADNPDDYGTITTSDSERTLPTIPGDYRKFYQNVRDAILGKAPLAVTPEQALNVMRVIDLAIASSKKRCALPWPK